MESNINHTHSWDWSHLSSWVDEADLLEFQPMSLITVVQVTAALPWFLFLILCTLSYGRMRLGRVANLVNKFPHYTILPLLGNVWSLPLSPEKIKDAFSLGVKLRGRRFSFWMLHKPYVFLLEAESVQRVLSSIKHVEKGSLYTNFHWLMGNGLITSSAEIWKEDRKLLSPFFKYQRFDGFLGIFNKYSHVLVNVLQKTCAGKETVLHPILCRATMDFINESALGQPSFFQYELDSKFLEAVHMILNNFRTRIIKPYLTLPFIWDLFGLGKMEPICKEICSKIVCDVIKSRKEMLLNRKGSEIIVDEPGTSSPFIDALLPTKSDEDILCHVLTIFGAGFETTASGMNYTLFLLAHHPEIQAKVHAELDNVVGNEVDVTFAHLAELKYLEMCIKESLRLYPPAPIFLRKMNEDVELDDGLIVPSGCDVAFLVYELHRDPTAFPDPEEFRPERFLPENCVARNPYAYIPFSIGPRNCLGMRYAMVQMKAVLVHILRNFKVSTTQRRENLDLVLGMVLEPSPPIRVTLTPRNTLAR